MLRANPVARMLPSTTLVTIACAENVQKTKRQAEPGIIRPMQRAGRERT